MSTVLLINGAEPHAPMAAGRLNTHLVETARQELEPHFSVLTTSVNAGYDVTEEHQKFQQARVIVFQFPVYWFALTPTLKRYIDDVYAYGTFFGPTRHYGRGGLLGGRDYLASTTWNASASDFGNPETIVGNHAVDDVLLAFHLTQQYVGLRPLESFSAFDVVQNPDLHGTTERWRAHLRGQLLTSSVRDSA